MKKQCFLLLSIAFVWALAQKDAHAESQRDAILAEYLNQAKLAEPGFTVLSAERGGAFFLAKQTGGKPGKDSCTACHGKTPQASGQTTAGKVIEPMALSKTPSRYSDKANVEKWFTRNCNDVLGRVCTAKEKGDFLTYMIGQ